MGGDKIVLLDGAGANGGGAAANGLLSMIPGMFANLIGGNKMDPNLVAALTASALSQQQTQNIVGQLRPCPVPAYPSCSPYQSYTWGQVFGGGCCNNGCGCNNGCCNNNAAV